MAKTKTEAGLREEQCEEQEALYKKIRGDFLFVKEHRRKMRQKIWNGALWYRKKSVGKKSDDS